MNPAHQLVDRYIQSWNETDAARRRSLLDRLYTAEVVYTDPQCRAHGRQTIDATIAHVQSLFPDHSFRVGSAIDAHHDMARFQWHLLAPGSDDPVVIGFDVLVFDQEQISQVCGFIDKAPQPQ